MAGKFERTNLLATLRLPRTVYHHKYLAVDTLWYQSQTQLKILLAVGLSEVEVLITHDRTIGIVDNTVGIILQCVWFVEVAVGTIRCLNVRA